jgi:hypothetical protein
MPSPWGQPSGKNLYDFAGVPPDDDVAVPVLAARPQDAYFR